MSPGSAAADIVVRAARREDLSLLVRWAEAMALETEQKQLDVSVVEPGIADGEAAVGLLKRVSKQEAQTAHLLLQQAHEVLQRLPAQGLTRAQLAADALGNAHALDNGQAVATVVLAALQHGASTGEQEQSPSEETTDEADGVRRPSAVREN